MRTWIVTTNTPRRNGSTEPTTTKTNASANGGSRRKKRKEIPSRRRVPRRDRRSEEEMMSQTRPRAMSTSQNRAPRSVKHPSMTSLTVRKRARNLRVSHPAAHLHQPPHRVLIRMAQVKTSLVAVPKSHCESGHLRSTWEIPRLSTKRLAVLRCIALFARNVLR